MKNYAFTLKEALRRKEAKVGVVGLGYVGLPLITEFALSGFPTWGVDLDPGRVRAIQKGESPILDVDSSIVRKLVRTKKLSASTSYDCLKACDAVIICVPTPLSKLKDPDLSHVLSAAQGIRKILRPGQLVVLESTTYPGTTQEVILPELSQKGLRVGRDLFLCYSPERIDPGNKAHRFSEIPKVVGGITEKCCELGVALYGGVVKKVVPVSSTQVAEMSKLLENTFRIVNIGLINELALVSSRLGINIWEAIEAARTKPFGFMPFYPGPGIGGHCIGIDPLYLSWKAKLVGTEIRFVELASRVNASMPGHVVQRAIHVLNSVGKTIRHSKILILGVSYKKDVSDIRESPALEVIEELENLKARVNYHDPFVKTLRENGLRMRSVELTKDSLRAQDLVIIVTDHSSLDYPWVAKNSSLILDTRNRLGLLEVNSRKVFGL